MEFSPSTNEKSDLYNELIKDKENENKKRMQNGSIYTRLARLNLNNYFNNGKLLTVDELITNNIFDNNSKLLNDKKGVFVSLKINGDLRGCIGTTEPTTDSIAEEIINNSISAALNDPRFSPLRKEELLAIDISVDILYPPEPTTFEELEDRKSVV